MVLLRNLYACTCGIIAPVAVSIDRYALVVMKYKMTGRKIYVSLFSQAVLTSKIK